MPFSTSFVPISVGILSQFGLRKWVLVWDYGRFKVLSHVPNRYSLCIIFKLVCYSWRQSCLFNIELDDSDYLSEQTKDPNQLPDNGRFLYIIILIKWTRDKIYNTLFVSIYVTHFKFRDSNKSIIDPKLIIYVLNILNCQLLRL